MQLLFLNMGKHIEIRSYELVSFRVKEIVVANIGHDHLLSFYVARLHFTADLLEDNYYSVCTATTVITL